MPKKPLQPLRSYLNKALLFLFVGGVFISAFALLQDRRAPNTSTFVALALWAILSALVVEIAYRAPLPAKARPRSAWLAARSGLGVFVAVAGVASLNALDHQGALPNANAFAVYFIVSALLGVYFAFPKQMEALLQEPAARGGDDAR